MSRTPVEWADAALAAFDKAFPKCSETEKTDENRPPVSSPPDEDLRNTSMVCGLGVFTHRQLADMLDAALAFVLFETPTARSDSLLFSLKQFGFDWRNVKRESKVYQAGQDKIIGRRSDSPALHPEDAKLCGRFGTVSYRQLEDALGAMFGVYRSLRTDRDRPGLMGVAVSVVEEAVAIVDAAGVNMPKDVSPGVPVPPCAERECDPTDGV
jgi:hypothetical protein